MWPMRERSPFPDYKRERNGFFTCSPGPSTADRRAGRQLASSLEVRQDGGMKRRWYHLHLVTCLAIAIVAADLGLLIDSYDPTTMRFIPGWWPLTVITGPDTLAGDGTHMVVNLVVYVFLLAGTAVFFELWSRRSRRFEIRLETVFILTAAIAAVLAFAKWDSRITDDAPPPLWFAHVFFTGLHNFHPFRHSWPIYVSLGCSVFVAGWLSTRLAGWCFRFVSHRVRRSPTGGST